MSRGNAKDIFGEDFAGLSPQPVTKNVEVKAHTRTKTIGGATKSIDRYSYEFKSWPRSSSSNASAGTVILMEWDGSEGEFTGRVTGAIWKACDYLSTNVKKVLGFRTQRGTEYGPFAAN